MEALIYLSWFGFIGLASCLIYGIWQEVKTENSGGGTNGGGP